MRLERTGRLEELHDDVRREGVMADSRGLLCITEGEVACRMEMK